MDNELKLLKNLIFDAEDKFLYGASGADQSTDYVVKPSDMIKDLFLMIQDYYYSNSLSTENNIGIKFSNGQKFLITVKEIL